MPAAFSTYFKNKAIKLAGSCSTDASVELSVKLTVKSCLLSLSTFDLISARQVESVIRKSSTKSFSLDPLPTVILKECLDVILDPIVHTMNTSLSSSISPSAFKISCVKPIIKKPKLDPEILANYRPISILPFISKVLERIVASIDRGVPQVLGPLLFSLYISEIEDLFIAHSMDAMIYVDDTQFYIAFKDTNRSESLQRLQHCIDDIRSWSTLNKLVLNDGKTEIIHIISSFARQAPTLSLAICCGSSTIIPKPEAQSLGLTIDNNLLLKSHVNNVCRSAFCALTNIGKIRRFLDQKTSASLVNALVISRLDHCNSLVIGLP